MQREYNFLKGLNFFFLGGGGGNFLNYQNVRGVEILIHRTGLLCKVVTTYHPAVLDLKKTLMAKWSLIQNQPLLKQFLEYLRSYPTKEVNL